MFNSGSDPMLKALKAINYLVVRLPKADLHPLQLLGRDGPQFTRLGDLTNVFTPGSAPAPAIASGSPTANINGSRTGSMKIGLGLSLLGNLIGAMGGSKVGLEVAYEDATNATFEFQNVTEDTVGIDRLDQFLNDADLDPRSVALGQLLDLDRVYLVTAVLRSDTFLFEAMSKTGTAVTVDVPVVQGIVGGTVSVEKGGGSETTLSYKGRVPLAFGFQAIQLFFENGAFRAFKPAQNVALAFPAVPQAAASGRAVFAGDEDNFVSVRG